MKKIRDNLIEEKAKERASFFLLLKVLLILLAIVMALGMLQTRLFSVVVSGDSMAPSLSSGDFLVVDRDKTPERGDIIIIDKTPVYMKNRGETVWLIKRVIGLPGEKVSLKDGYVYINDVKLDEPYVIEQGVTKPAQEINPWTELVVPEGEYLFLGDNRIGTNSKDSRYSDYLTCNGSELVGVVCNWSLDLRWLNNSLTGIFGLMSC